MKVKLVSLANAQAFGILLIEWSSWCLLVSYWWWSWCLLVFYWWWSWCPPNISTQDQSNMICVATVGVIIISYLLSFQANRIRVSKHPCCSNLSNSIIRMHCNDACVIIVVFLFHLLPSIPAGVCKHPLWSKELASLSAMQYNVVAYGIP